MKTILAVLLAGFVFYGSNVYAGGCFQKQQVVAQAQVAYVAPPVAVQAYAVPVQVQAVVPHVNFYAQPAAVVQAQVAAPVAVQKVVVRREVEVVGPIRSFFRALVR